MIAVKQQVKTKLLNMASKNNFSLSDKLWEHDNKKIYSKKSLFCTQITLYGEVDTGFGKRLHRSRCPVVVWRGGRWQFDDDGLKEIDRFVAGVLDDPGELNIYK